MNRIMLTNWLKHTKCCITHAFNTQNPQWHLRFNILEVIIILLYIIILENTVKVSAAQCVYVHMHNGLNRKSVDPKRIPMSSRIQM